MNPTPESVRESIDLLTTTYHPHQIELRPIPEEQSEDGESEHYFPVWSLK